MSKFVKPTVIDILGSTQEPTHSSKGRDENQSQADSEPSLWGKFKMKAKHIWNTVMTVTRGVRENIVPIITSVGTFLTGLAAFCNRAQKRGQQGGRCKCTA